MYKRQEGVFQLESAGMQSFMKELSPQSFEDIVAGISPVSYTHLKGYEKDWKINGEAVKLAVEKQ